MGKIGDETKTERTFRHCCCSLDGIKETMAVEIRGTGSYIPEKIVENRELEQMIKKRISDFEKEHGEIPQA